MNFAKSSSQTITTFGVNQEGTTVTRVDNFALVRGR